MDKAADVLIQDNINASFTNRTFFSLRKAENTKSVSDLDISANLSFNQNALDGQLE